MDEWSEGSAESFSGGLEDSSEETRDVVVGIDKRGRDVSEQLVVGAGAMRGEQDLYTMRDLQGMKVPRLRAMCDARGLKKIGTKLELINRLLASTIDADQPAPAPSPTPSRLNPSVSPRGAPSSLMSSGSSPVPSHAAASRLAQSEAFSEEGSGSSDSADTDTPPALQRPAAHPAMVGGEAVDPHPDYRPSGEELARILDAPRIVRRAGRAVTLESSRVQRYQPDRKQRGSSFSALSKPTDASTVSPRAPTSDSAGPTAQTLNGIPREFLPPSLRSFDPSFQNRRRGPGRPRSDGGDGEEEAQSSEWEMVKAGGGMQSNPQASPFDAMIAADQQREAVEAAAAEAARPRRRRNKAVVVELLEEEVQEEEEEEVEEVAVAVPAVQRGKGAALLAVDDDEEEEVDLDIDEELPDLDEDNDEANIRLVFEDGTAADEEEEDGGEEADAQLSALFRDDDDALDTEDEAEAAPAPAPVKAARRRGRPRKAADP